MRIAVLIPCYNEEGSVENVVRDFMGALPESTVYVYDNNSTDHTAAAAAAAGAVVRREARKGKGFVVHRMFADIDADVYILVDGDGTYSAGDAPRMIQKLCEEQLDVVNGLRVASSDSAFRPGHRIGNSILSWLVSILFGGQLTDMMSGYKVFSRRFVKTFSSPATGFEIDTVLMVHALSLEMPVVELQTSFRERKAGSTSKLRPFRDGGNVVWSVFRSLLEEHPVYLFGTLTIVTGILAAYFSYPVALDYLNTGRVQQVPSLLLAAGLLSLSFLFFTFGLMLDLVFLARREAKRLRYLEIPAAASADRRTEDQRRNPVSYDGPERRKGSSPEGN